MKNYLVTAAFVAAAFFSAALSTTQVSAADIDLSTLTLNGGASSNGSSINLGNGTPKTAMSAFVPTPYATEGLSFSGSFNLSLSSFDGERQADGVSFIIQGDKAKDEALGGGGGNLGAQNIQHALGIGFQSWDNNAAFIFTTATFGADAAAHKNNFSLGDNLSNFVKVTFGYANGLFEYSASNLYTKQTISQQLAIDIKSLGDSVYLGFTGGTGGASAYQNVSKFQLTTSNVAPVPGPEAGAGLGALVMGGAALVIARRKKAGRAVV